MLNVAGEYLQNMEEYIPPLVDAAAPGGKDTRNLTSSNQPLSGVAFGEMHSPMIRAGRLIEFALYKGLAEQVSIRLD